MSGAPWWENAVVYQIYPRSFCDTDGDGVGDLEGVRRHVDHLVDLGADAVWLSPFYPSPMADFGYDVADYCDVDPLFGTLADFDRLVADLHAAGLRLLIDWVPNHTSDRHPWFLDSRSSTASARRDWYVWRDGRADAAGGSGPAGSAGRLPNNWRSAFAGIGGREFPPAWTWDEATGQWYLHSFLSEQPDLNWAHPDVRRAMADTLRFWLDRGVDGFRVDAVHVIGKDPELGDLPADVAVLPATLGNDRPETHDLLAELRRVVDAYPDRVMVGEVFLLSTTQVAPYYGSSSRPELQMAFNFAPLFAPWKASAWRRAVDETEAQIGPVGWPAWVLSNHDLPRHRSRYGSEARARAAAVLLCTLRGTPFLYAGEELGLEDAVVPAERRVDPGGRDGQRAPLPWTAEPGHGWAGGAGAGPWLPWPPGADTDRNVAAEDADAGSVLHLYRRLLAVRRASPALHHGAWEALDAGPGVLAYRRRADGDERLVAINFTRDAQPWPSALDPGAWVVEVSSDGADGGNPGILGPDRAVVLRPTPVPEERP